MRINKLKNLLSAILLIASSMTISAQKKNIVLHYDFKSSTGSIVHDKGPNKINATLKNGAYISNSTLMLGTNNGYLDMSPKAGELISKLTDFTICAQYKIDDAAEIKGYGYFLWCFSCLEANQEKDGPYHAYRINEQRCETSIGGWSQETGIQQGAVSQKGKWISIIFRQKSGKGELFIDGKLIGTETNFPEFNDIFKASPAFNWIGRPPFNGDNYLKNTTISDFRIYDKSISDKELKKVLKMR